MRKANFESPNSLLAYRLCLQTWTCALLSMGHGAATFNSAVTCFAIMLNFGKTYSVTASSPIPLHLRIVGGVAVALGVVVGGWLLVPVSGMVALPQLSSLAFRCTVDLCCLSLHCRLLWPGTPPVQVHPASCHLSLPVLVYVAAAAATTCNMYACGSAAAVLNFAHMAM